MRNATNGFNKGISECINPFYAKKSHDVIAPSLNFRNVFVIPDLQGYFGTSIPIANTFSAKNTPNCVGITVAALSIIPT